MLYEHAKPRVNTHTVRIPASTFVALNTSYSVGSLCLRMPWRILDIDVIKETVFDNGLVKIGHDTAANRESIATGAEVAATVPGISSCSAFRTGATNLNDVLRTANRTIFARCETALPTVGELILIFRYYAIPGGVL